MIILAAAIILSLSNSGIILKANKAKTDSDNANLKEYVNTLKAEWELMTAEEREKSGSATFEDYANKKLEANGYKQRLSEDGTLMNESAAAAVKAGIKIGDRITGYTVAEGTYTTSGEENTCDPDSYSETAPQPQIVKTNTQLTWKYLGVNANGELEMVADYEVYNSSTGNYDAVVAASDTEVALSGKGGYLKGPEILNVVCKELYSKDGVGTARSININDILKLLDYNGPKGMYYDGNNKVVEQQEPLTMEKIGMVSALGSNTQTPDGKNIATYKSDLCYINRTTHANRITEDTIRQELAYNSNNMYWIASLSNCAYFADNIVAFNVCYASRTIINAANTFISSGYPNSLPYAIRPVVTLNSNVKLTPNADKTEWTIK